MASSCRDWTRSATCATLYGMTSHLIPLCLVAAVLAGCAARGARRPAEEVARVPAGTAERAPAGTLEEVTFAFAPPDGLVCHERRRQVVRKDAGPSGGTTEDVTDAVVRHRIERRAEGWRLTMTTLSAETTRNGTPVSDPLTAVLVGRDLRYDIGPDGSLARVEGLDELRTAVRATASPDLASMLQAMLEPAVLIERERTEWQRRITDLVGRRVRAGEVWEGRAELTGQAGTLPVVTLTRFSRIEPRGERIVVTVDFAYAADAETARRQLEGTSEAAPRRRARRDSSSPTVVGSGSRLIEAGTMTVLHERLRQVAVGTTELPGAGRTRIERTDLRESVVDCRLPAPGASGRR